MKSFYGVKLGLPSSKKFANRVYNLVYEFHSEHGVVPSISDIALRVKSSKRTLQRWIAVEDITFDEIILDYRRNLFSKLIILDIPINQMADQLGFRDHTSLYAFSVRNWGMSPSYLRKEINVKRKSRNRIV